MRRLDGVGKVTVDLKLGTGEVFPGTNRSFDPTLIFEAIEKAGFSAPKVEITVVGTIELREKDLALRIPGQASIFLLQDGSKFSELQRLAGKGPRVGITGLLDKHEGKTPPHCTVEKYEVLDSSPD